MDGRRLPHGRYRTRRTGRLVRRPAVGGLHAAHGGVAEGGPAAARREGVLDPGEAYRDEVQLGKHRALAGVIDDCVDTLAAEHRSRVRGGIGQGRAEEGGMAGAPVEGPPAMDPDRDAPLELKFDRSSLAALRSELSRYGAAHGLTDLAL